MTKPTCEDTYLIKKRDLKNNYYSIVLNSYKRAKNCNPGHFVQVQIPSTDVYFRRPMSVASVDKTKNQIEMIFKVFGRGTALMSQLQKGDRVNILGPLGQPFSMPDKNETIIIIAGGVGFPPLMFLTKEMVRKGYDPSKIEYFYGGRTELDIIEKNRIKKLGVSFHPVTENGKLGTRGLVTKPVEQFIKNNTDKKLRIYACGPEGMLKASNGLGLKYNVPGQVSLEAPMPCGVGICLGCVVPLTEGGHARVCFEGPVFNIGEVAL
jgi:dihydroorotate dehydrogenase electron transfer subunit